MGSGWATTDLSTEYSTDGHCQLLGSCARCRYRNRHAPSSIQSLTKLSFSYYDNIKTGHIITHVTKDLEEVGEVAHHGPEDLFIAVMTFIGAFILMATVHLPLAMVTIIIVPFMTYLVTRYGSK